MESNIYTKNRVTETNTYFAKATMPANGWKSPWSTYEQACVAAKKFIQDWKEIGVPATCAVFYRTGQMRVEFGGDCEPDADMSRMEHDDKGDN